MRGKGDGHVLVVSRLYKTTEQGKDMMPCDGKEENVSEDKELSEKSIKSEYDDCDIIELYLRSEMKQEMGPVKVQEELLCMHPHGQLLVQGDESSVYEKVDCASFTDDHLQAVSLDEEDEREPPAVVAVRKEPPRRMGTAHVCKKHCNPEGAAKENEKIIGKVAIEPANIPPAEQAIIVREEILEKAPGDVLESALGNREDEVREGGEKEDDENEDKGNANELREEGELSGEYDVFLGVHEDIVEELAIAEETAVEDDTPAAGEIAAADNTTIEDDTAAPPEDQSEDTLASDAKRKVMRMIDTVTKIAPESPDGLDKFGEVAALEEQLHQPAAHAELHGAAPPADGAAKDADSAAKDADSDQILAAIAENEVNEKNDVYQEASVDEETSAWDVTQLARIANKRRDGRTPICFRDVHPKPPPAPPRGAASDTDDVSTDTEFIKVNVINRGRYENTAVKVFPLNKQPQRQPYYGNSKVRVHVVDQDGTFGVEEAMRANARQPGLGSRDALQGFQRIPQGPVGSQSEEARISLAPEDSSSNRSNEATQLINELRKYISEDQRAHGDMAENRFVFNHSRPETSVAEAMEISDFRERSLHDQVKQRMPGGKFLDTWVNFKHATLNVFRGVSRRPRSEDEAADIFANPTNPAEFLRRVHSIDFQEAEIFVSRREQRTRSCLFCYTLFLDPTRLENITDKKIYGVVEEDGGYTLDLMHEDGRQEKMHVPVLDVAFREKNRYYYFRTDSVDRFLKWVLIYRLRRFREIHRLGEEQVNGDADLERIRATE